MIPAALTPWAWALAAVVVALLELSAPGYYLIWIACAAAVTAIATFAYAWTLSAQLTIFIAASLICCAGGFFVYRRLMALPPDAPALNRRDRDLIGAAGVAADTFVNGHGKVRIGDSVWLAEGPDGLAKGAAVTVTAVRGTTVVVVARP
jgi:membrane protein implicated in regulation of membrane protease activity